MAERLLELDSIDDALAILGSGDANIRRLERQFGVCVICRGTEIKVTGEETAVDQAARTVDAMLQLCRSGTPLDEQALDYCTSLATSGDEERVKELTGDFLLLTAKGKPVRPKTLGQKSYIDAIKSNTITFGVGPAGTGKTYLAVAMAVRAFKAHEISRIILTRPAVEAGEKLGFLPGDLQNKVDPYLRPLYDGLFEMLGPETYQKLQEKGVIEVAPLAYMRGRTLDDSFIILDEAQNTTPEQMKMFLTRMGMNSKVVVNGDVTQIDLPDKTRSGLNDALGILKNIEGIACIRLTDKDVVRHRLVQEIVRAYEKAAAKKQAARGRNHR
ncbi:MAG TPA: PhoH family protein [Candidatus Pygmaiobacter gallistercoris]|nr:PhoH family protein [Candidatus Pygmaiobacter gallistercoris]